MLKFMVNFMLNIYFPSEYEAVASNITGHLYYCIRMAVLLEYLVIIDIPMSVTVLCQFHT